MAYWQWGETPAGHVIVCVHGLSRQGRDFDVLAQALLERAGRFASCVPTWPGEAAATG
jgi:hypothetical protein